MSALSVSIAKVRFYALKTQSALRTKSRIAVPSMGTIFTIGAGCIIARRTGSLQALLAPYVSTTDNLTAFRAFILGIGAALLGATAIAFSLILFAMQVNVERMPHGLFQRLSADLRLLLGFLISFATAICVSAASIMRDANQAIYAVYVATLGALIVPMILIYAYRRALKLINPIQQLIILQRISTKQLRKFGVLAQKLRPIYQNQNDPQGIEAAPEHLDMAYAAVLASSPGWDADARRSISYAISFARRFGDIGDLEVSAAAMRVVRNINATYCEVKRDTFFAPDFMLEQISGTDAFISHTLEELRVLIAAALSQGNERLTELGSQCLTQLAKVYATIEYAGRARYRLHVALAIQYLSNAATGQLQNGMV